MRTKARAQRADVMPREPRCRVCRDPAVRILVNEMLDWRGVPIRLGLGKTCVTWSPSTRAVKNRTGSPMTPSGSTPRGITTLMGSRPTGQLGSPKSCGRPCGDNGLWDLLNNHRQVAPKALSTKNSRD